jgi:hypothetical protein
MLTSTEGVPTPKQPRKKAITSKQLPHAIDFAVNRALEQTVLGQDSGNYRKTDCFIAALSGAISIDDHALGEKIFSVFGHGQIENNK